jgi:hypothetical protein
MIRGTSGQAIGAQMVNAATGAAFAGTVTVYVTVDAGVQTLGTVGAGVCTAEGNGYYTYLPSSTETDGALIGYTFIGAGAIPATIQISTILQSQIAALQATSGLTSVGIPDLLLDAAVEIRVARAGGTLEPGVAAWMLRKLNRLIDRWNATPGASFSTPFQSFTPTVSHAPHTLGPSSADWALTTGRPNKILGANVVLNTVTPNVRIPIRIRDVVWFQNQAVRLMTSSIVTDLYYESAWPNGLVNLWPVPTATYPIELRFDDAFTAYGATDTFYLPSGYADAVILSLAEECANGLGQTPTDQLHSSASDARVNAFGATLDAPRLAKTRDAGMPGGQSGRSYLYRTGRSKDA